MVLPRLRDRYEQLGYEFIVHPGREHLSGIPERYRPDAIALRAEDRVAIEIKGHSVDPDAVVGLRQRFGDAPRWRLVVVFDDDIPSMPIPATDVGRIREASAGIADLADHGQAAAALVMAFSLLEAVERLTADRSDQQAKRPATVVQSLAMTGLLDRTAERSILDLSKTRNAIVHGDLEAVVDRADVALVLAATHRAIAIAFAG